MLLGSGLLPQIRITRYLARDEFLTARLAGAVNGTAAEPGPGARTAPDSNSKLTIAGGALTFAAGGAAAGNPGLWLPALNRAAGRIVTARVTPADTAGNVIAGWDTNQSGTVTDSFRFGTPGGAMAASPNGGTSVIIGTYAAQAYDLAVVLRDVGAFWFLKTGGGAWSLMWLSTAGAIATVYPALSTINTVSVYTADYLRVPAWLWLPSPLASDGFGSTFGTTDGLGHAEGVAGGLGSGGAGVRWTDAAGTWAATGGVAAASALSEGVAVAVVDAGVADVIATAKVTHVGGTAGLVARYADANNYVTARHTGTNVQLAKVIAGVATTLIDTVVTYVANAELCLVCEGQAFRVFYDGAAIGAEQTIADAGVATATQHGLRTSNTGNTFDDFVLRARGSGGEYARLDNL